MLNPTWLKSLELVFDEGSVTGAADILMCSPSNVTQHIRRLENATGRRMVRRNGRGVTLTTEARSLVERSRNLLLELENLDRGMNGNADEIISVAAFPTALRGLCIPAIRNLHRNAPQITVKLIEAEPARSSTLLQAGTVDAALLTWPGQDELHWGPDFDTTLVAKDPIDILVPYTHVLASRPDTTYLDLHDEPLAISPKEDPFRVWLDAHIPDRRKAHYDAGEIQTLLEIVQSGIAITALPRLGRGPLPPGVVQIPLKEDTAHRSIFYVTSRHFAHTRTGILLQKALVMSSLPNTTEVPRRNE